MANQLAQLLKAKESWVWQYLSRETGCRMSVSNARWPRFLHISDLHFGREDPKKTAALISFAQLHKPEFVCVTGDVVDFPRPRNFKRAHEFLTQLRLCGSRVYVIPGNHDALLRAISLNQFKTYLHSNTEFGDFVTTDRGIDVCLFGVDTTCLAISQVNNTGKFSERSHRTLERAVADLKEKLGPDKFSRALKVCLVHHHPLPTLSSQHEGMLYFKNCGKFLDIMAEHGFDMVMHGHKHEPTYFSVNYNRVGEGRSITVLSAGTATKAIDRQTDVCRKTQIYLVEARTSPERVLAISSYNFDHREGQFYQARTIRQTNEKNMYQERRVYRKYIARAHTWNMAVEAKCFIRTVANEVLREYSFQVGVDPATPACERLDDLHIKIWQDATELGQESYHVDVDEPRRKKITVTLPREIDYKGSEITYTYEWPQGFDNLARNSKDGGTFAIQERTDQLVVELEIEPPNAPISMFRVRYHDEGKVEFLHDGEKRRRGFKIDSPAHTWGVEWNLTVEGNSDWVSLVGGTNSAQAQSVR